MSNFYMLLLTVAIKLLAIITVFFWEGWFSTPSSAPAGRENTVAPQKEYSLGFWLVGIIPLLQITKKFTGNGGYLSERQNLLKEVTETSRGTLVDNDKYT